MSKILVIGACGQIGTELVRSFRKRCGTEMKCFSFGCTLPGLFPVLRPDKAFD